MRNFLTSYFRRPISLLVAGKTRLKTLGWRAATHLRFKHRFNSQHVDGISPHVIGLSNIPSPNLWDHVVSCQRRNRKQVTMLTIPCHVSDVNADLLTASQETVHRVVDVKVRPRISHREQSCRNTSISQRPPWRCPED
jgi:hypothetical protein